MCIQACFRKLKQGYCAQVYVYECSYRFVIAVWFPAIGDKPEFELCFFPSRLRCMIQTKKP